MPGAVIKNTFSPACLIGSRGCVCKEGRGEKGRAVERRAKYSIRIANKVNFVFCDFPAAGIAKIRAFEL